MKKEIEYHEVAVWFVISAREAKRVTGGGKKSDVRSALAQLILDGLTSNTTECMDVEELAVAVDGQSVLGQIVNGGK